MSETFMIGSINMIENNTGKFHRVDFTMTEKFKYVIQNWYDKAWSGCEVPHGRKYDFLTGDMTLFELGMDSLDEVELILNLELVYNISITDDKERTIKLTCGDSGVIVIEGKCNYQTLKTIRLIDDFLNAQSHVDYCKDFMENGSL